jgi:hypothetical protein
VLGAFALGVVVSSFAPSAAPTRLLGVYEEELEGNCAAGAPCLVYLSTILNPLKVTKVSCNFYVRSQNASMTGAEIGHASEDKSHFKDGAFFAPVEAIMFGATATQYQFLADTLTVIPAHWRPTIELTWDVTASGHYNCHIAGSES